jgi:pimeloyl-ACP methyl ester carboxylesterase
MLLSYPKHTFAELEAIQCPVLVMQGENGYIKKAHTEGIAAHIPHSTLMIVPGQRHRLPVEDPALFNRLVLEFLTGRKGDL